MADIPVYLVAGFLDAGKTNFINGILEDGFARQDPTLLLCCEEGEEEYEKNALDNVTVITIEDEEDLKCSYLKELEKEYHPKQVLIEYNGMWQMERLYREGAVRAIGVSNFLPHHLEALLDRATVKPMVNQIEFHPGFMQRECTDFCRANGILVEAWSPLGTGRMLTNETLKGIAARYGKSVAQLCIRWALQHGVLPLPKSVTPERIRENLDVFGFEISDADMQTIDRMAYCGGSGLDPDEIDF